MPSESLAIEIRGLTKRYGEVRALDGLTLSVERGQLFGLLGPNGAGKTTLISILTGIEYADEGSCSVLGHEVPSGLAQVKPLIGVCPQSAAILGSLTGLENVELFGALYGFDKRTSHEMAESLLDKMGLENDAGRRADKYSEGMKRRLSVAMALVHEPMLAFLDEPTVGMDPQSRRAVWDFLLEMKKDSRTIVLTTHHMEEAERLCDKVGIIDHGKLIEVGTPGHLIAKYGKKDLEEVFIHLTGRKIREE